MRKKLTLIILCITLLTSISLVHAQNSNKNDVSNKEMTKEEIIAELQSIALIPKDGRLEAYDELAKELGVQFPNAKDNKKTATNKKVDKGKWIVTSDIDPMTDKKEITFILQDNSGAGSLSRKPTLAIRYQNDETELLIAWNEYLADNSTIKYRFDKNEVKEGYWSLSTNNTAVFYPGNPKEFIKKIMKANKFVARITPYNSGPVTAVFDVKGLKNAAKPYADTLDWVK
ncbi:MAG: type VI secretion system protein VasI [Candidatus Frackibacter sp. T328-2]|nr:MAG: type VI secretion system protein VasI [Candidatus Frackibacter sp. T328-2]